MMVSSHSVPGVFPVAGDQSLSKERLFPLFRVLDQVPYAQTGFVLAKNSSSGNRGKTGNSTANQRVTSGHRLGTDPEVVFSIQNILSEA
jgi:hypothetical protein